MDKSVYIADNDTLSSEHKLQMISEKLHDIAKEISLLADQVGRRERMDFDEVLSESIDFESDVLTKTGIEQDMFGEGCSGNSSTTQCYHNDDELYEKALNVIRETKRILVSHLQLRMGIGYNHASRLIDMLEERGIIGPARSIEPRRVINWDKFGEKQDVAE